MTGIGQRLSNTGRRICRRAQAEDDGTSLLEVLVGMVIMTFFMAMFTGAMFLMTNTASKVQAISVTSNQASYAFLRLDREVRYATAISTPAYASSTWHVEFSTSVVTRSATNAAVVSTSTQCTQLAVAPPSGASGQGVLKQRTWNIGDTTPGAWVALANNITNYTSASTPFPATTPVTSGSATGTFQQLTVNLVTADPSNSYSPTTTTSKYTFVAVNSTSSNTAPVCQQFAVGT